MAGLEADRKTIEARRRAAEAAKPGTVVAQPDLGQFRKGEEAFAGAMGRMRMSKNVEDTREATKRAEDEFVVGRILEANHYSRHSNGPKTIMEPTMEFRRKRFEHFVKRDSEKASPKTILQDLNYKDMIANMSYEDRMRMRRNELEDDD